MWIAGTCALQRCWAMSEWLTARRQRGQRTPSTNRFVCSSRATPLHEKAPHARMQVGLVSRLAVSTLLVICKSEDREPPLFVCEETRYQNALHFQRSPTPPHVQTPYLCLNA